MSRECNPFIGLVLRRARRDAGLSQRDLASRSGVPASTVAAAEAATRELKVTAFGELLEACGWSLYVVDRGGAVVEGLPAEDGPRDAAARRYPAHVELRSTESYGSWWGDRWGTYWGRPPRPVRTFDLPPRPYAGPVTATATAKVMDQSVRVAAYAVIVDSAGRVLLARLTGGTTKPPRWTLPGGGLEHGEHPEAAVVRKVHEDTGLSVRLEGLLGVDSQHLPPREGVGEVHDVWVVYRATAVDEHSLFVHESDGTNDQARWVSHEELESLDVDDLVRFGLKELAA